MKTIRFDKADVLTWESTFDEWIQEAMNDSSDIATVVSETINSTAEERQEQIPVSYTHLTLPTKA